MKKALMRFRFTFGDGYPNSTMEAHATGIGVTKDDAEAKAWQALAANEFNRQLILSTVKIEKLSVEFSSALEPVS